MIEIFIFILIVFLLYLVFYDDSKSDNSVEIEPMDVIEGLDISKEADQNIVSVYNDKQLAVTNLDAKGTSTITKADIDKAKLDNVTIIEAKINKGYIGDLIVSPNIKLGDKVLNLSKDHDTERGSRTYNTSHTQDGATLLACPAGEYMAGMYIKKNSSDVDYITTKIYCRPLFAKHTEAVL
jgi:hypothetical protein